jgi:hypothetical protein
MVLGLCLNVSRRTLPLHAAEILVYAAKNKYAPLLAEAASLAIDQPLSYMLPLLAPHLVIPWVPFLTIP